MRQAHFHVLLFAFYAWEDRAYEWPIGGRHEPPENLKNGVRTMKTLIASSLLAVSLILALAPSANAEPQFGSRTWWDAQTNG